MKKTQNIKQKSRNSLTKAQNVLRISFLGKKTYLTAMIINHLITLK
jgi:hypothetical protein